jgi:hypothetical protein
MEGKQWVPFVVLMVGLVLMLGLLLRWLFRHGRAVATVVVSVIRNWTLEPHANHPGDILMNEPEATPPQEPKPQTADVPWAEWTEPPKREATSVHSLEDYEAIMEKLRRHQQASS